MLINQLFESNKLQQDKPKTRNPVAKNAPRSGAGAHANKKRAERNGEVKHKKSATANDEIKESQHRPEQAVMILRRIPEGYRGARLYEKIMNTIIKRLGPAGPSAERREFYQTLAADVMERYIQKFPDGAAMREDRASDEHRKAQVRLSDAIDRMIVKLEAAKNYQAAGRGEEAQRTISDAMSMFADAFERKLSREKYEDFIVPLDWSLDTLANETWDAAVVNQTIDISINLLDEMNNNIWREIMQVKDDDDEGGISVGDLNEAQLSQEARIQKIYQLLDQTSAAVQEGDTRAASNFLDEADALQQQLFHEEFPEESYELFHKFDDLVTELDNAGPEFDDHRMINEIDDLGREIEDLAMNLTPEPDEEGGIRIGDLSENYDDEDDEEGQEDVGFFVVIANEDDGVFIGYVTKEDGRWYEQRVSGQPPYAWGGPKYMSYLTPRDIMTWIRNDYERHHEVKGPFADEESARDYAEQYLGEGVAEGLNEFAPSGGDGGGRWYSDDQLYDIIGEDWLEPFDVSGDQGNIDLRGERARLFLAQEAEAWLTDRGYRVNVLDVRDDGDELSWYIQGPLYRGLAEGALKESGETYTWTAHFADGTTKQMDIATDEVPYAREAFARKFPNKTITKVDTDWRAQTAGYSATPTTTYPQTRPQPDNPMVREGDKDNFTIDDIKHLETINDFATLKAQAKELIKGKPSRRMKPEKIAYFYNAVDKKSKPIEIIKLMYDLLLAGEGHQTIGSRHSTNSNTYRQKFGEGTLNEAWSLLGQKSKGNLKVKIYKDKAWDRYAVEFYKGSYYDPRENFYTDDKQSAIEEIQRFFSYGGHGIGESSQVHGQETAKKISPVLTRPSKKHPFNGRLVGENQHHDRKENIESSLVRRIKSKHMDQLTDALQKFGIEHVMQTISNTVDDYATIDELGSSDISIMVKQILKQWSRNVQ